MHSDTKKITKTQRIGHHWREPTHYFENQAFIWPF